MSSIVGCNAWMSISIVGYNVWMSSVVGCIMYKWLVL